MLLAALGMILPLPQAGLWGVSPAPFWVHSRDTGMYVGDTWVGLRRGTWCGLRVRLSGTSGIAQTEHMAPEL